MDLAGLIAKFAAVDGVHPTSIPRLDLVRFSHPTGPVHAMHEQALVIVAQGAKEVILGDKVFTNGPEEFLIVSIDVPIIGRVIEATPEAPYLCMRLHLDVNALGRLLREGHGNEDLAEGRELGLSLGSVTQELLAAATRLVALLASPRDIPVLAPLAEREILYRLLLSEQASRLRQIASADSKLSQVGKAIDSIKQNYDKPLRIEDIARGAGMSTSALHRHFRAITALSPLQFQKRIRLQEARSLMFTRAMDAAVAGHQVGYESPSQFSRDYKRLFGVPPKSDLRSFGRMQTAS